MPLTLRCGLTGTGQPLVACGDLLLARGHVVVGVLTECRLVREWAARHGIARSGFDSPMDGWLQHAPFDHLFSIVNHVLLPAEILAAPARGAINYHDSLLPEYAGFNATSWAILEGRRSHGVTWHEMTAHADRGAILVQQTVEILDEDTAFTLGVKCAQAGVSTFALLIDQLERNGTSARAQTGSGSSHRRSDRPALAVLDFSQPVEALHRMVRALNFASEDNWLAKPKVALADQFVTVTEATVDRTRAGSPGTVLSVSAHGIEVAARDGSITLSNLSTSDGLDIDPVAAAARFDISAGSRLGVPDETFNATAHAFDVLVTRSERFWVQRLSTSQPATLPGTDRRSSAPARRTLTRELPFPMRAMTVERRCDLLVAAFTAYLYRLGAGDEFDIGFDAPTPILLRAYYADRTPFRCTVAADSTVLDLINGAKTERMLQARRQTYARDVILRYAQLRGRDHVSPGLPVGVRLAGGSQTGATVTGGAHAGPVLTLVVDHESGYAWEYDSANLSADEMTRHAERFDRLLAAAASDEGCRVPALPLVATAERELLLQTWQDTHVTYDPNDVVHRQFEQQVERTPSATAAIFGDESLTYRELNDRANGIAHALRARGAGPGVLVGICVERSLDLVAGLLGILKAGGAYVPLDPAYPRERLEMMLEDSKAPIVITQQHLASRVTARGAVVLFTGDMRAGAVSISANPASGVTGNDLAYVMFTSGSTGRPKGTMIEHRNVANFFVGMDAAIDSEVPGVWLAVTSVSFDISVLELFWTLARGYTVVVAPEADRASLEQSGPDASVHGQPMQFGLFYFSADSGSAATGNAYRLLIEGAKFADEHDFAAVWTPERHFHAFGGLYPNPAVTTAALSTITRRVHLRAGSVVLPLHNPLRVAEDWAVIDQLSGGRVGLSFASGWHVNDFAFMPGNFERRRDVMVESIDTVLKLWRGESVSMLNGAGQSIDVHVLPRPVQPAPPIWIASAGSVDTFVLAGRMGANVLTNMLGQDLDDLEVKFAAYRAARREHGHDGPGIISVMLHTYVCASDDEARRHARKPFSDYLASSFDLVKVAPKMFPAFRQPSQGGDHDAAFDASAFTPEDMDALLEHAFDRYFDAAGLFGTPERALRMVDRLAAIGATEMACLVDFGIDPDDVLRSLPYLERLQSLCRSRAAEPVRRRDVQLNVGELIERHAVTHLQCTPSMARVLLADERSMASLRRLDRLLLGGEALPVDLATRVAGSVSGRVLNMYGPTETTIWSTTAVVDGNHPPTIGRPIANTTIRILDARGELVPVGTAGELHIGGAGVARGYLDRPDLTAERFVSDPWLPGGRLYRTGDLARYRDDGKIEFLGRLDHQVKLNGYRVELGEIETALTRHQSVRQSVVVAREGLVGGRGTTLTAYVELASAPAPTRSHQEHVDAWRAVWDNAYASEGAEDGSSDPRFRIDGWTDSFTGAPIPAPQMREWLDATVARLRSMAPRRVVEIGCGTGMILYRMLPTVDHYVAVDISQAALTSIRGELTQDEASRVTLLQMPAHDLTGVAERSCDLVIINSVTQYFPDTDYLTRVVSRAVELVSDGGHIFIGDVRSSPHLGAFHTAIELAHAPATMTGTELMQRAERRVSHESELALPASFFEQLAAASPRLQSASVQLKRGASRNELTTFRYDVVLKVMPATPTSVSDEPSLLHVHDVASLAAALHAAPPAVYVADVPNARLSAITAVLETLATSPGTTAGALRATAASAAARGVDPEAMYGLDTSYSAQTRWASSGDPGRFDVLLSHTTSGAGASWPVGETTSNRDAIWTTNRALHAADPAGLIASLREHLGATLPAFMIPTDFVVIDELPLTPNGKIDRKALPKPAPASTPHAANYIAPTSDLEQQIAGIWKELLAVDRVGRQDNIFDLGANSLLTMQANNRLSALLGTRVSLVSMFRYPTVETLAAYLGNLQGAEHDGDKRSQERASRAEQTAARRRALRAESGR